MKYCYHCGQALGDDFAFCPRCGKTMPALSGIRPAAAPPVYEEKPIQTATVGGRVMAGLSKGLGITGLVFSIMTSIFLFSDDNLLPPALLTALFSVPALLLSIFARKKGAQATKGMVFGIIGCSVCSVLLLALLALL